jgi:hypothetical protein
MMAEDFIERISGEWKERAPELAAWVMRNLVNRTDVWGRYLAEKYRGVSNSGQPKNKAITAPFARERGKIFLQESSLVKHFKAKEGSGILGLHSQASNGTSRWLAIDIDYHDDNDYTGTREANFLAAKTWYQRLQSDGFDPLLFDSNGDGGYHLWLVFEKPMEAKSVRSFCQSIIKDYSVIGLDNSPDLFPGTSAKGSWLRIPGRHHTRKFFTRVWNDDPTFETNWLNGHDAIDRMLAMQPATASLLEKQNVRTKVLTICLDFDGVIHSYQSGWQGEAVIADPPIHKVDVAIKKLRKDYRVVVFSARCRSDEGVEAIRAWLAKHHIEVDDVCREKPPAHIYVDDRAVRFDGDWDQTIADINLFKK